MPVATLTAEFSFDVAALDDDTIKAEFNRRKPVKEWAHEHWKKSLPAEKTLSDFSDADLLAEVDERDIDTTDGDVIDRLYSYLAERDIEAAMDLMHREYGLAPPSHARAVADLISGAPHAEN
ncbi:hypothetical protein [Shinella sp. M31]|uniref:hypothetical protein n=1 Tax=Shinella sp. M31 TaxID=3368615 RepID=UPI003B9E865F